MTTLVPVDDHLPASAEALLAGLVDYAGLFPPAALDMGAAVAEYAAALDETEAWMLGRFVLPARRLPEFAVARAAVSVPPQTWRLSATVAADVPAELAAVADFNASQGRDHAVVDAIECRPRDLQGLEPIAAHAGDGLHVYVEIDPAPNPSVWLEPVAARGLRAKIRMGGTTADAFPPPAAVVAFLSAALQLNVPFKATAGLHHAVRGSYRLTYDADATAAPMYGYLNLLLATAALGMGLSSRAAEDVLTRTDASSLVFADDGIRWDDLAFPSALLRRTRAGHLVGLGSCSFREPVAEMRSLLGASR